MPREVVGVHLAHDERDRRVHPPGTRVVDDGGATLGGLGRERGGCVTAGAEQRDVDTVERLGCRLADRVHGSRDIDLRARASLAREEPQLGVREGPLDKRARHRPADQAGRADDGDGEGLGDHVGHGSAVVLIRSGTAGV